MNIINIVFYRIPNVHSTGYGGDFCAMIDQGRSYPPPAAAFRLLRSPRNRHLAFMHLVSSGELVVAALAVVSAVAAWLLLR
jgi:hypothetical protein